MRHFISAATIAAVLTLSACGSDDAENARAAEAASESASAASASASAAEASESAEAAEERSEAAEEAAQEEFDECDTAFRPLLNELAELNSRLSVGLNFDDYSTSVADVRVVYDQAVVDLDFDSDACLPIGTELEKAYNQYAQSQSVWNDCINDDNCIFSESEQQAQVQKKWARAGEIIEGARSDLDALAP
jgi:hypothetical protein